MIPKIIHQIWIQGHEKIHQDLKIYYDNCKIINNNFQHILWDDTKIRDLLIKNFDQIFIKTYNNYKIFAQKADFARYAILYIYGGIYLDMDMMCKKNLSLFLNNGFFCTSYIFPDLFKRYLNGIIGARKNHPVFMTIFENIFKRKNITKNITDSTGTGLFYDSIQEYIKNNPNHDIKIVDRKYLDPCNIYNNEKCKKSCTDCYIVHTNYSSWSPTLKICKYIIKYKNILLIVIIIVIIIVILIIKSKFINL